MKESLEGSIQVVMSKDEQFTYLKSEVSGVTLKAQSARASGGAPRVLEITELRTEDGFSKETLKDVLVALLTNAEQLGVEKIQIKSAEALQRFQTIFAEAGSTADFDSGRVALQAKDGVATLTIDSLLDPFDEEGDEPTLPKNKAA